MPRKHKTLVLTVLGPQHPEGLEAILQAVADAGCSIQQSRMMALGSEMALFMLLSGDWSHFARLESGLPAIAKRHDLLVQSRQSMAPDPEQDRLPYSVEVIGLDRPGIVHELTGFFTAEGVEIIELHTSGYQAPRTGSAMCALHMTLSVPADLHLAALRERFMELCDRLNLDAMMEPVKT